MTLWHFLAAIEGYGRSQGWKFEKQGKAMSVERLRELGVEGF